MDLRKLKKLIDLVEESGIAELEITEGEERVRITRNVQQAGQHTVYVPQTTHHVSMPATQPAAVTEATPRMAA